MSVSRTKSLIAEVPLHLFADGNPRWLASIRQRAVRPRASLSSASRDFRDAVSALAPSVRRVLVPRPPNAVQVGQAQSSHRLLNRVCRHEAKISDARDEVSLFSPVPTTRLTPPR